MMRNAGNAGGGGVPKQLVYGPRLTPFICHNMFIIHKVNQTLDEYKIITPNTRQTQEMPRCIPVEVGEELVHPLNVNLVVVPSEIQLLQQLEAGLVLQRGQHHAVHVI